MKLAFALTNIVILLAVSGAFADGNPPAWTQDQGRRVLGGDILYYGVGYGATPEAADLKAEGMSLRNVLEECGGFIHKDAAIWDRYITKTDDAYVAYARASIPFSSCDEGKHATPTQRLTLSNIGLTVELQKFEAAEQQSAPRPASIGAMETTDEGPTNTGPPLTGKPFWLGLGIGGSSSSTASQSNAGALVTLGGEYNFTRTFALGLDYFGAVSSGDNSTKGVDLRMPISPIYFGDDRGRFFLEPGAFYQVASFTTGSFAGGNQTTSDVNQVGWQGSVGMDYMVGLVKQTVPTIFTFKLGVGSPLIDSSGTSNTLFFRGSVGAAWSF